HWRRRMDHGAQVRVTEIMHVGGCGIEKGRAQRIDPFGSPDQGCSPATGKLGERGSCNFDRFCTATPKRDCEEIDEGSLGLMSDVRRNVLPPRCSNVARKDLRDQRLMQHAASLVCLQHQTMC